MPFYFLLMKFTNVSGFNFTSFDFVGFGDLPYSCNGFLAYLFFDFFVDKGEVWEEAAFFVSSGVDELAF